MLATDYFSRKTGQLHEYSNGHVEAKDRRSFVCHRQPSDRTGFGSEARAGLPIIIKSHRDPSADHCQPAAALPDYDYRYRYGSVVTLAFVAFNKFNQHIIIN